MCDVQSMGIIRALQPMLSRVSRLASNSYTLAATTHCRNKIIENFDTEADRSRLVQSKELQQKYVLRKGKNCQWSLLFLDFPVSGLTFRSERKQITGWECHRSTIAESHSFSTVYGVHWVSQVENMSICRQDNVGYSVEGTVWRQNTGLTPKW